MSLTPPLITTDLPCSRCHYNLRTLPTSTLCPECATPITHTLQFQTTWGHFNFEKFRRGSLLIAFYAVPDAIIRLLIYLGTSTHTLLWIALLIAATILRAALLVSGVYNLAFSKNNIPPFIRTLCIGIAICIGLAALVIQPLRPVLAMIFPAFSSTPALWASIYMAATLIVLLDGVIFGFAWFLMHDFACRRPRRGFLIITHLNFTVMGVGGLLFQLLYDILGAAYYLRFFNAYYFLAAFSKCLAVFFFLSLCTHMSYWFAAHILAQRISNQPAAIPPATSHLQPS